MSESGDIIRDQVVVRMGFRTLIAWVAELRGARQLSPEELL